MLGIHIVVIYVLFGLWFGGYTLYREGETLREWRATWQTDCMGLFSRLIFHTPLWMLGGLLLAIHAIFWPYIATKYIKNFLLYRERDGQRGLAEKAKWTPRPTGLEGNDRYPEFADLEVNHDS